MKNNQEIRTGRHCVFMMRVHGVFVAQDRRQVLDADAIQKRRFKVAVSNLVNSLRGVSGRLLRKERPDVANRYCKNMLWSPPCLAASCGGAPIDVIRRHIEQQQTPH